MAVRLENSDDTGNDIIIKCKSNNPFGAEIYRYACSLLDQPSTIPMYKDKEEFFIETDLVLYFETEINGVIAHTRDEKYKVKQRLYELELTLPDNFMRISKSAIANTSYISSITRSFSSSGLVQFKGSNKKVYVSRKYINELKVRLLE